MALATICSTPISIAGGDGRLVRIRGHTERLASDELEGRGNGSRGLEAAAAYIEDRFVEIGLGAAFESGYRQELVLPGGRGTVANLVGWVRAAPATAESVVVTAHYDGLGVGEPDAEGDAIYNGALDNAVGAAALIELARGYAGRADLPRHLIFVATAGEESPDGAWGARRYLDAPPLPAHGIVVALNIDGLNVYGRAADVTVMPRRGIDFRAEIAGVAAGMGLADGTADWVDGLDRSFDSAEFLARGVPAVTVWWGSRFVGLSEAKVRELQREIGRRHHRPSDEVSPLWSWEGVEQHVELYARLIDHYLAVTERPRVLDPARFRRDAEPPSR